MTSFPTSVHAISLDRVKPSGALKRTGLTVNDVYVQLKQMTVLYDIRPGERINEVELAQRFKISRGPLREALNRLVAEHLLAFVPNRGFFVRQLERQEVYDLYQLRHCLEVGGLQLAVANASDAAIEELEGFWDQVMQQSPRLEAQALLAMDEAFHLRLMALSGNAEMVRSLEAINARIHFVRWMDLLGARAQRTYSEHHDILRALRQRDGAHGAKLLQSHIGRRMEEVTQMIQASVVKLYTKE